MSALIIGCIYAIFLLYTLFKSENIKTISLYVLVDNEGRISYTGSKEQCKDNLTKDLKLIKLEGIL